MTALPPINPQAKLSHLDQALDRLDLSLGQFKSRKALDDTHRRERLLLVSIKALLDSRDVPTWLKSISGHMLYVNPAFTKRFHVSLEAYGGRADGEVWPETVATQFEENDRRAIDAAGTIVVEEEVNDETLTVRKWPVFFEGQLVGVAGEVA